MLSEDYTFVVVVGQHGYIVRVLTRAGVQGQHHFHLWINDGESMEHHEDREQARKRCTTRIRNGSVQLRCVNLWRASIDKSISACSARQTAGCSSRLASIILCSQECLECAAKAQRADDFHSKYRSQPQADKNPSTRILILNARHLK